MSIGYYISVPFAWLLRVFYQLTDSYGWALVLFTLAVKVILLPFQAKSKKGMIGMNRVQPKIQEIQKKYANNQQKQNEEIQKLYAEEGVNPMSGCLWSLIPFPILIALYSVIRQPLSRFMFFAADKVEEIGAFAQTLGYVAREGGNSNFYSEIWLTKFISEHIGEFTAHFPDLKFINLNYTFFGLDLTDIASNVYKQFTTGGWAVIGIVLIPILSAVLSVVQMKVSTLYSNQNNAANKRTNMSMMLVMPLMSLWIAWTMPAALGVYWIANTVFSGIQDFLLDRYYSKRINRELSEREKKKRDERLHRIEMARQLQSERDADRAARAEEEKKNKRLSEKAAAPKKEKTESTTENGRVGDRPYARGRSFSPDHYGD